MRWQKAGEMAVVYVERDDAGRVVAVQVRFDGGEP
jgi:hypothetical protein